MALKTKPQGRKTPRTKGSDGIICIIHFSSTVEETITPAAEEAFNKITSVAQKRLTFSDVTHKLQEIVPQRGADPLSRHRQPRVVRFFPSDNCLFCDKQYIQVNRKKQILVNCVTPKAVESIKTAAEAKGGEKILCKVRGQDLQTREAWYHNYCRRYYTRDIGERQVTQTMNPLSHRQHIMLHLNTSLIT